MIFVMHAVLQCICLKIIDEALTYIVLALHIKESYIHIQGGSVKMKKTVKWMFAMILVLCMVFSTVGIRSYAAGTEKAVKIGDLQFDTLAEAVEAANAMTGEEPVVIELMEDVELGQKLEISRDITIEGGYTIYRSNTYLGTLMAVSAGATLTLDGLTIDGNNDWVFDEAGYRDAVASGQRVSNDAVNFTTYEEGAPIANAAMITIAGEATVVMNGSAIQNSVSSSTLFSVPANACCCFIRIPLF